MRVTKIDLGDKISEVLNILRMHTRTAGMDIVSGATPIHDPSVDERDLPPVREEPDEIESLKLDQVEVKSHGGGLVQSFVKKAA